MSILNGTTAPASGDGVDGDFWINTAIWSIYGPKAGGTWPAGVSMIGPGVASSVTYDDTATQLGAANVQAAIVAMYNRLPVLTDVVLSSARYVHDVAADTVIADIGGWMPGAVLSIDPDDGRFKIIGNQQDGFKLAKGATATAAGDVAVTIRQNFPAARNGPTHDTAFTLMAMSADRLMVGLSRVRVNSGALVVAVSGTERKMSLLVYDTPQYATNGYRLHYSGFASTEGGNSPQETMLPGNDTVIEGVWAIVGASIVSGAVVGGVRYRLTFAGANGVTIASGAGGAWTDDKDFPVNVLQESAFVVATEYRTTVGQNQIPNSRIQKHRGERIWGAAAGVGLESMLDAPGTASAAALDTNYGVQNQPQFYGPDILVQKGWDGRPVALVVCDSIGESRQEFSVSADARGNLGWLRRWLDTNDATHGRTPHYMIGLPGAGSVRELATSAFKRWDNLDQVMTMNAGAPPFTVIVDQMGQNDLQTTYATMRANYKNLVTRLKARYPGAQVVATGVLPRTTSTDFYKTRANQTPVTNNTYPTGNKWLLEADKAALMDATLSGYIPTNPYWYDAAYPGTWPLSATTTLAAQAGTDGVATYSQITVTAPPNLGDLARWGASGVALGVVIDITGAGPYVLTMDRNNVAVAASAAEVIYPVNNDQVHPYASAILAMAAAIPQSEKAKLTA